MNFKLSFVSHLDSVAALDESSSSKTAKIDEDEELRRTWAAGMMHDDDAAARDGENDFGLGPGVERWPE